MLKYIRDCQHNIQHAEAHCHEKIIQLAFLLKSFRYFQKFRKISHSSKTVPDTTDQEMVSVKKKRHDEADCCEGSKYIPDPFKDLFPL